MIKRTSEVNHMKSIHRTHLLEMLSEYENSDTKYQEITFDKSPGVIVFVKCTEEKSVALNEILDNLQKDEMPLATIGIQAWCKLNDALTYALIDEDRVPNEPTSEDKAFIEDYNKRAEELDIRLMDGAEWCRYLVHIGPDEFENLLGENADEMAESLWMARERFL